MYMDGELMSEGDIGALIGFLEILLLTTSPMWFLAILFMLG